MRILFPFIIFLFLRTSYSALSLYATEQNIGITKTSLANSCTNIQACDTSSTDCYDGHELTKISSSVQADTFVGTIFFLPEGRTYHVIVDCEGDVEEGDITMRNWNLPVTFSHTFYVSPSGTGDECSSLNPCAVDNVFPSKLVPGTEVILTTGENYQNFPRIEDLEGTSTEPIVIRGPGPGNEAIIDGSKDITSSLVPQGGGVYRYSYEASGEENTNMVVIISKLDPSNVKRLLHYHDHSNLLNLQYDNYGYYVDTSHIDINIDTELLSNYYVLISTLELSFDVRNSKHIYFFNLNFKYVMSGSYPKAIYAIDGCEYLWVKDCIFDHSKFGYKYGAKNFLIENNLFKDSKFHLNWNGVKGQEPGGSTGDEGGPIRNYGGPPSTGRGFTIRRNEVSNFFDGLGGSGGEDSTFFTSEIDMYENYIHEAGDDAIEADGHVSNVRIYNNIIENCLVAFSFAPAEVGPIYVINNFIKKIGQAVHDSYTGMLFKYNHGSNVATGMTYIYHNVGITDNQPSSAFKTVPTTYASDPIVTRNNIWLANPGQFAISIGFELPFDFDYDALYSSQDGELAWWTGLSQRHLTSIEMLRTETGHEINGIELSTPDVFEDESEQNYLTRSGTEPFGQGVFIKGINSPSPTPNMGLLSSLEKPVVPRSFPISNLTVAIFVGIPIVLLAIVVIIMTLGAILLIALVPNKPWNKNKVNKK